VQCKGTWKQSSLTYQARTVGRWMPADELAIISPDDTNTPERLGWEEAVTTHDSRLTTHDSQPKAKESRGPQAWQNRPAVKAATPLGYVFNRPFHSIPFTAFTNGKVRTLRRRFHASSRQIYACHY